MSLPIREVMFHGPPLSLKSNCFNNYSQQTCLCPYPSSVSKNAPSYPYTLRSHGGKSINSGQRSSSYYTYRNNSVPPIRVSNSGQNMIKVPKSSSTTINFNAKVSLSHPPVGRQSYPGHGHFQPCRVTATLTTTPTTFSAINRITNNLNDKNQTATINKSSSTSLL